jgi:AcrR family transcriptional regulator
MEKEGLRDRKRRQTKQRIVDAGLKLFLEKGVEATTLDEVAEAADISRRSFFSYFASKEELVMAWQDGAEAVLRAAVIDAAPGRTPLEATRTAVLGLAPVFANHNFVLLDGLMRSTPTLRARKQVHFEQQERALAKTLIDLWPDRDPAALKATAMLALGSLRLAIESWLAGAGEGPIEPHLDRAFAAAESVF